MHCPGHTEYIRNASYQYTTSYGLNHYLSSFVSKSTTNEACQVFFKFDLQPKLSQVMLAGDSYADYQRHDIRATHAVHSGASNYVFCDGHVQAITVDQTRVISGVTVKEIFRQW